MVKRKLSSSRKKIKSRSPKRKKINSKSPKRRRKVSQHDDGFFTGFFKYIFGNRRIQPARQIPENPVASQITENSNPASSRVSSRNDDNVSIPPHPSPPPPSSRAAVYLPEEERVTR